MWPAPVLTFLSGFLCGVNNAFGSTYTHCNGSTASDMDLSAPIKFCFLLRYHEGVNTNGPSFCSVPLLTNDRPIIVEYVIMGQPLGNRSLWGSVASICTRVESADQIRGCPTQSPNFSWDDAWVLLKSLGAPCSSSMTYIRLVHKTRQLFKKIELMKMDHVLYLYLTLSLTHGLF
jgi:hypothetical protein